ncbi:MAG: hypothetical protein II350_02075, partial [Clostridia bacterium]|nr:hypothetical protein [Clostridia bacterium]
QKPDILHAPIYIWVWNSACTKELIDKQLLEMEHFGVRAFYILPEPKEFRPETMPTYLSPDYMSEEFLDLYAYAIERGTAMGMTCWIYDEGGWPSGGACGMVLRDHPEYAKRALTSKEVSFAAQSAYKATAENFLAAFTENNEQIGEGYVFEKDTVVTEYYVGLFNFGGSDYPDLLNREATEYFLNVTHDKYASALGSLCGSVITAVFTDEPKAPVNPINAELISRYEKEYGESVLPYLPLLAGKVSATEENAEILRRWYDLCSKEFCRNFLLPCKEWSNARGMAFTGHLDRDHDPLGCINGGGHFHLMRGLRCLDLPGIDIIWRQLYPNVWMKPCGEDNGYNGFFPRYASSAARQTGTEFAMTESLGVLGPGVPYEKMRYMLGYQAVRGINVFNFFNIPLGREGNLLAQELPVFTEEQVYFNELSQFNSYVERLSYIASLGDRICDTALYYPVNDFWGRVNAEKIAKAYDTLGRELEYRLIDFDIIDDDIIAESWKNGEACLTVGRAVYRNIVIPENAYIPPKTAEILDKFVAAGGKVFRSADSLRSEVTAYGNSDGLRACRRNTESGELLLLFREDGETGEYRISVSAENIFELSLENGEL